MPAAKTVAVVLLVDWDRPIRGKKVQASKGDTIKVLPADAESLVMHRQAVWPDPDAAKRPAAKSEPEPEPEPAPVDEGVGEDSSDA